MPINPLNLIRSLLIRKENGIMKRGKAVDINERRAAPAILADSAKK